MGTQGATTPLFSASTREKMGYFGALDLKTGCLLTKEAPTFNAETFGDFLHYLLQYTQGKIHLILDNVSWHKAQELTDFFAGNRDRLVRIFPPHYSPELNPMERVWRITRRQVTHNRYFESTDELRIALGSQFAKWEKPNGALTALCACI